MSDFKINPALCFYPKDLIRFMRQNTTDNSLTQEIAAALMYRVVFEKEYGWKDYFIYFEPKQAKDKELLEGIGSTIKMKDLVDFIENNAEQATINDVLFVRRNDSEDADVRPVQMKRFGKGMANVNSTEAFIEYLKKIKKKYPKNKATLLVHFETKSYIDFPPVIAWLEENEFNFEELVMFTVKPDMSAIFCQLLPNSGEAGCIEISGNDIFG